MKLSFNFEDAQKYVAQAIEALPQKGETRIPKPAAMFDEEGNPLDLVARVLVLAGLDPHDLDEEQMYANTKHFFLKYSAWIQQNMPLGGPHFTTVAYLSSIALRMDHGMAAGRAERLARRHAIKLRTEQIKILPHTADRW